MGRAFFVAASLSLAACSADLGSRVSHNNAPVVSTTGAAVLAADPAGHGLGFDPGELDGTIRPEDDLWAYANGKWLAATTIPPDWASYGAFEIVAERTEAQVRTLAEPSTTRSERKAQDPDLRKVQDFYASFMDETRVESAGLKALEVELAAIAALRTHADVVAYFGVAMAAGVQIPVQWFVDADATEPSRNLAYFWQDGLGLPDRDYYLDDRAELREARSAYEAHIERLLTLAKWQNAAAAARTVLNLETRLAERQWTAVQNRDDEKIYGNQYTLAEASKQFPNFDWTRFLAAAAIHPPVKFVVAQTEYFASLGSLINDIPVGDWQTWLRFKSIKRYAPYLNAAIVAEDFSFQGGTLRGMTANKSRWKRGVALVSEQLGEIVGRSYVERYFPPASKARMDQLIDNLREAFHESIDVVGWMTPATRRAAQEKLANFTSKIGYPDRWRDYSSLVITRDDLIGNVRRAQSFEHDYQSAKLSKPVDRNAWLMTPQTVNAYYQPTANEIVFPAAILQPPFFDPAADDAYNYGSIGATIGHEFSHGFDDQGRKFDGTGRLRDWWTIADAEQYLSRANLLVAQFDEFRPLPNFSVNGQLTLGENIADLAGLVIAYRAWQTSLEGRESPVLNGFTGAQRFFIGYALSFRGKDRPERLQAQLLSDPHAPAEYRVTGIVRNLDEFYSAFAVGPGDKMYLPPADRASIW